MLIYLGCIQLLLVGRVYQANFTETDSSFFRNDLLFLAFTASAIVFWLTWGGYSVDAWRYLARFDFSPFLFREEQIFWISGYLLNKVVPDPWPLKILSTVSVLILAGAYYNYFRNQENGELTFAYILLLLTPGFYLLTGNAVRQGLSGSLELFGAVFFLQQRYWSWMVFALIGFFVHQFGIIVFGAVLIARFLKKNLVLVWFLSFIFSPVADYFLGVFDYNLESILRYGSSSEGYFHWGKVVVSGLVSSFVVVSLLVRPSSSLDFRHLYIALIVISNSVLLYEVPFERIFLFSDLVAPLALAQIFASYRWSRARYFVMLIVVLSGSLLLWTNHSIVKALGYT
ncbi:MAG: EpsG family protein [bacterium]